MKKIYLAPKTIVVAVKACEILAGSGVGEGDNAINATSITDGSDVGAKSFFDDWD